MVDVTPETEPTELERTRLNAFIRFAIDQHKISTESIERLTALTTPSQPERPLIDPDIQEVLPQLDLPDTIPIAPSVRTLADFTVGQTVSVFLDVTHDLHSYTIDDVVGNYLKANSRGQAEHLMYHLIAPFYVGLFSEEDYQFYRNDHPREDATGKLQVSHIYIATELGNILARLGMVSSPDQATIRGIRRHFGSSGIGYTQKPKHTLPLKI